ncbi:hypothetical protein BGZ54_000847 [Gamsiella multidivaricata]|nr:hypothetical protein BGZ54_000847 [Gamsiella multidivaricata]
MSSAHPGTATRPKATSTTAATTKTSKAKPAPKTKTQQKDIQSSSSDASKASSAPKTPKVFRFEGSISSESFKTTKSFDLAGVNILNRKPLDTKAALDKLQRRRETHNRVERKRRDCINQLIDDLTKLLPTKHLEEATSKCHRVNVLRGAVSHIKFLNESNDVLAKSIRAIHGEDAVLPMPASEKTKADIANKEYSDSMDVDDDDDDDDGKVKGEDEDEDERESMDEDRESTRLDTTNSRSTSPSESSRSKPSAPTKASSSSPRKMAPPPVIVTNAPSDPSQKATEPTNVFSLESRPRANSFASSISDQMSPKTTFTGSPMFPPSPISPLPYGRSGLFPSGEDHVESGSGAERDQRAQLSPFMSHSPMASPSPSLPPISSLAIQSPSGHMDSSAREDQSMHSTGASPGSSFSGRPHRGGATLPPLTIPEPHHLHPSYQQGGPPGQSDPNQGAPSQTKPRPKSLQPESIFIQEEPWNAQRKRSASSVSGKGPRASIQDKKRAGDFAVSETSDPTSPTSSITSTLSYPASPNPKKRTQLVTYDEGEDENAKRPKQVEYERDGEEAAEAHQPDSGVVVVVKAPESEDQDAAHTLTNLAQTAA